MDRLGRLPKAGNTPQSGAQEMVGGWNSNVGQQGSRYSVVLRSSKIVPDR